MNNISVVIITLNAEERLDKVLSRASMLSSDIVIVDCGSTDQTEIICRKYGCQFHQQEWLGYGAQKNYANSLAKHPWILSIDEDEVLSDELIKEIQSLNLDEKAVYSIPFINWYCGKQIKFGRWRNERHVRIFNKIHVSWSESSVHEGLTIDFLNSLKLEHPILHYSMNSKSEHLKKAEKYSKLGAKRLHANNKKASFVKQYLNPVFRFVLDYFIFFGFLDGELGFQIATISAKETFWKYRQLKSLE
jgi:glycosyltransferase involved in cell wall biosynthesis